MTSWAIFFCLKSLVSLSGILSPWKYIHVKLCFPFLKKITFFSLSLSSCHLISLFTSKVLEKLSTRIVSISSSIFSLFISNQSSSLLNSTKAAHIKVKNYLHCLKFDINFKSFSCMNYQQHLTSLLTLASLKKGLLLASKISHTSPSLPISDYSTSLYFVGHFSNIQQINIVIPQNPLLWPTLFFLYIHSLYSSSSLTSNNIYLLSAPQFLSPSWTFDFNSSLVYPNAYLTFLIG